MRAVVGLTLLVAAAAAVFVAGWTQLFLGPDTYAVLFSKTDGYHPDVVKPGSFSWHWQRVIPTNVTLFRFDLRPHVAETRITGELPSAPAFATVLPTEVDFGFDVAVVTTFALRPEALPALVASQSLTPESLAEWSTQMAHRVARAAHELLQRNPAAFLSDLAGVENEITATLSTRFPDIVLAAIQFTEVHVPDLELYERARAAYLALVDAQDEARQAAVASLARRREADLLDRQARLDSLALLREYGAVFEQYPMLLEFLSSAGSAGVSSMITSALAPTEHQPSTPGHAEP